MRRYQHQYGSWIAVSLLLVALLLVVLGVNQGDALEVWRKAILVCFECIGIG